MNATGPPIYTLDFRSEIPKHFVSEEFKGRLAARDNSTPPILVIENITAQDDGIFSCRADYKWSRTQGSVIKLNVIGEYQTRFMMRKFFSVPDKVLSSPRKILR